MKKKKLVKKTKATTRPLKKASSKAVTPTKKVTPKRKVTPKKKATPKRAGGSTLDFARGDEILQQFIRGDALIGIMPDIDGSERTMLDSLWSAARAGSGPAYLALATCYGARLQTVGAFEGVREDGTKRPWSKAAAALIDDDPFLQSTLRASFEATRLGAPGALIQFARLSRGASDEVKAVAEELLAAKSSATGEEVYQLGLVQHWRGNLEASAKTHRRAADLGNSDAMFELSLLFGQGLGVEADAEEARFWLQRAADVGHPRALYNLGSGFATGAGGTVDLAKAASFYRRAAEAGHARAASTLGVMILSGELEGTRDEAKRWLTQADEGGFPTADMLEAAGLEDPRQS